MPSYDVRWVDAFTTTPLQGNACAVVLDARGLDDARMQAIAREFNLSETAFVFPGDGDAHVAARYFTPVREIPMAGHPTVATVHALVESGRVDPAQRVLRVRLPAALVPVEIRRDGPATTYAMTQPEPAFERGHDRAWTARALGLDERDLVAGPPPQTVSTGTPQLVAAVVSPAALDRCRPDRTTLFGGERDYFSVHVVCAHGVAGARAEGRHFAEFGDVIEDPVTGSGIGNAAAYCARYGLVDERAYDVAQGRHVGRAGRARVEIVGEPPDGIAGVVVGGPAVTVVHATLALP